MDFLQYISLGLFFSMLLLAFVFEAHHDFSIKKEIELREFNDNLANHYNEKWHEFNWMFYLFFVGAFINILTFNIVFSLFAVITLLIWIIVARSFILNTIYNTLNNQDLTHLSNNGIDKFAKKYIGEKKYFILLLTVFLISMILIFITI